MSKRKNTIIIICFILVILLGAGAAAYPLIASINNERTQSLVQTEYEEKLQQLDTSEIDEALKKAHEYNKTISTVQIEDIEKIKESLPPYEDLLNLANNGIMGYIEVGKKLCACHAGVCRDHGVCADVAHRQRRAFHVTRALFHRSAGRAVIYG